MPVIGKLESVELGNGSKANPVEQPEQIPAIPHQPPVIRHDYLAAAFGHHARDDVPPATVLQVRGDGRLVQRDVELAATDVLRILGCDAGPCVTQLRELLVGELEQGAQPEEAPPQLSGHLSG